MAPLRIVFAGSPAVAVPSLEALLASDHEVVGVLTREDAPTGRKRVLTATPVALAAEAAGVPVIKAGRPSDVTGKLLALRPDLGVVVAFGALIREPLLSAPAHGWINLHFSLLPRWRGAAPVAHAIMAGDEETGACVFRLVPELDAGPVLGRIRRAVGPEETAGDVLAALSEDGAGLLARVVDEIAAGTARAVPQEGEPTFAPKLDAADGRIDWSLPTSAVSARIRGATPEPGAFAEYRGERFKVLAIRPGARDTGLAPGQLGMRDGRLLVGAGDGALELVTVQPAGRRAMPGADWWRGLPADTPKALG